MAEGSDRFMKKDIYTEIICKGFCSYYKGGKEDLTCGAYNFLAGELTPRELSSAINYIKAKPDFSFDGQIIKLVCERCDFLIDGCDFREGLNMPPCGGYTIVEWLMKNGA